MTDEPTPPEAGIADEVAQARKRAAARRSKGKSAPATTTPSPAPLPPNFKILDGRLFHRTGDTDEWRAVCSAVEVSAFTRSGAGDGWGLLVELMDPDGQCHATVLPRALLAGDGTQAVAQLSHLGLCLEPGKPAREALLRYLATARPKARARIASATGWNGEVFVLPDAVVVADSAGQAERVILEAADTLEHAFRQRGTLAEWQARIARLALGNSRLVFAIATAFAGPLLKIADEQGGGWHLRGGSSSGKSTALAVAGSVWGGGGVSGFVRSWRATDNGLEALAALHSDALLALDEFGEIDARSAAAASYMLANGVGKARAGRDGHGRPRHSWRVMLISSGEIGLVEKLAEIGQKAAAGIAVRVVEIPADAGSGQGLFEDLHGASSAAAFATQLKAATGEEFGTAAPAFLRLLVQDIDGVRRAIKATRRTFLASHVAAGADGQVERVAQRFALVAAAGELASTWGVTGWPAGTATAAAARLFGDWLHERGGSGPGELMEARRRLASAIERDGHARFHNWHPDSRAPLRGSALGFCDREASPPRWFVSSSGMEEVLAGLDWRRLLPQLAEAGVIAARDRPGRPREFNRPLTPPSTGHKVRLFELGPRILVRPGDPDPDPEEPSLGGPLDDFK